MIYNLNPETADVLPVFKKLIHLCSNVCIKRSKGRSPKGLQDVSGPFVEISAPGWS